MGYTGFWKNQTYQPFHIYNQKEDQVYNEIYTDDWWQNKQNKLFAEATLIPILFTSDKTVLSLSYGNQLLWPVYVTIGNLDVKIRQSQNRPGILLLGSIPIIHE